MMRRARNSNALVRDNIDIFLTVSEAIARIGAQIHLVMSIRNVERLRQFSRARAKAELIVDTAAFFHEFEAAPRFDGAKQNEAVCFSFYEHIQHPVRAVA